MMKLIIKCGSDELLGKEFNVYEKVIVSFQIKGNIITKEMLVEKKECIYLKNKNNLSFELVDYTDVLEL